MKHKYLLRTSVIGLVTLLSSVLTLGQATPNTAAKPVNSTDSLAGLYEGVAKDLDPQDLRFKLELKSEGGKISGRAFEEQSSAEITESTFVDGVLTLKLTSHRGDASMILRVEGEKMVGEWILGERKGSVELKKIPAAAPVAAPAEAPINLSGEWEAVADAQGQPFPFSLILKVEGEKVSGGSSSQLGDSTISTGTWKDGQLNIQLESANGTVVLSATVIEGKLSGVFDFAGQLQGKWVAVRRK